MKEEHTQARRGRQLWTRAIPIILSATMLSACGYSQEEWDQKTRENETLRNQLEAQRQAYKKAEQDHADAVAEVEALKKKLRERGLNVENLTANLQQQKIAMKEYQSRLAQLDEIRKRFQRLRDKLEKLTKLGLKIAVRDNRMVIQLPGDVLFDSGKDKLKPEGISILGEIAKVINNDPDLKSRHFQVAGHTDSKPLKGGPFKDNWGLSAMRARSVVLYLTDASDKGAGLDKDKWSAAGYADTDPVAKNDTDESRAKNRRVELVVLPNVEEMLNLNQFK